MDLATWFIDLPSLVYSCSYSWNIRLDILLCVLDILSNCVSPLFCCGDLAKCSSSLSKTSLPSMFIVLMSTSSIV